MLKENEATKEDLRIMLNSRADFVSTYNATLNKLEQGNRYITGLISEASSASSKRSVLDIKHNTLKVKIIN